MRNDLPKKLWIKNHFSRNNPGYSDECFPSFCRWHQLSLRRNKNFVDSTSDSLNVGKIGTSDGAKNAWL